MSCIMPKTWPHLPRPARINSHTDLETTKSLGCYGTQEHHPDTYTTGLLATGIVKEGSIPAVDTFCEKEAPTCSLPSCTLRAVWPVRSSKASTPSAHTSIDLCMPRVMKASEASYGYCMTADTSDWVFHRLARAVTLDKGACERFCSANKYVNGVDAIC